MIIKTENTHIQPNVNKQKGESKFTKGYKKNKTNVEMVNFTADNRSTSLVTGYRRLI